MNPEPTTVEPATSTLTLYCASALRKPVEEAIIPAFTRATGLGCGVVFDSTSKLLETISDGARPDVFVGLSGSFQNAVHPGRNRFQPGTHLATSGIGVAAAAGAGAPDITSVQKLALALITSRSVAYSPTRPSGIHFHQLLQDLGIAELVNSRATFVEEGPTANALVDGRATLAVQQISELKLVPEVTFLGPLPDVVQKNMKFSAYLSNETGNNYAAAALFNFLRGSFARSSYTAAGLSA